MPAAERLAALARDHEARPVDGPTYRPMTRALAAVLVAGLLAWGARLILAAGSPSAGEMLAAAALAAVLLWPMPSILFGRTVVDGRGIRQGGWMGREVAWHEIQRVRFARVPLSPRLLVSPGFSRVKVFYSGSAALDDAFARIADELTRPDPAPAGKSGAARPGDAPPGDASPGDARTDR